MTDLVFGTTKCEPLVQSINGLSYLVVWGRLNVGRPSRPTGHPVGSSARGLVD
jgi:hypothetical protein